MTTLGQYDVIDELYRTQFGYVATVRPRGGDDDPAAAGAPGAPRLAAKVFSPTVGDARAREAEAAAFVERARLQQHLGAKGARHWAKVHDVGPVPGGGAYYVTDYHPLSLKKLIQGRVTVTAAQLHRVVSSIVAGLQELRTIGGRTHGNLKASNVLILGQGNLADRRVVLTDPGSASLAASAGEVGDRNALGALIHELVLDRPFEADSPWPLPPEEPWQRLGPTGDAWRRLCSDLVSPLPRPGIQNWDQVAKVLRPFAPKRKGTLRPGRLAAAVLLLLLVAAGGFAFVGYRAQQTFCRAKQDWLGAFAQAAAEPQRKARYAADPALRAVVAEVERLDPGSVDCDSSPPFPTTPAAFRTVRGAGGAVRRIEANLSAAEWDRLGRIVALRREFEARRWAQPAEYLGQVIKGVEPRGNQQLAQGIDRLLGVAGALEPAAASAGADWKRLDEGVSTLSKSNAPLLGTFARALRRTAVDALRLSNAGLEGTDRLKANADLTRRLLDAEAQGEAGTIDLKRFTADVQKEASAAEVTPERIEQWLGRLERYAVSRQEIDAAAEALRVAVGDAEVEVVGSNPDLAEKAAFDINKRNVEGRINTFQKTPYVRADVADGTFEKARARLADEVEKLREFRRAQTPAEWIAALPVLATSSQRVNEYWQSWKRVLPGRFGNEDDLLRFETIKAETNRLRNLLANLDRDFPAVPKDLAPPAFQAAAKERRERELANVLQTIRAGDDGRMGLEWKPAAAAYSAWVQNLRKLAADFPLKTDLLTLDDRPHERWAKEQPGFWKDPAVQALVEADVDRITRVQQLRGAGRSALVAAALEETQPEVVLTAWQLLGGPAVKPAWPEAEGELDAEARMRQRLKDQLKTIKDVKRRTAAQEDLHREKAVRWRRAVEAASSEVMLAGARELRGIFEIGRPEYNKLSPAARFNLSLYAARQHVRQNNDAGVKAVVEELKQTITEMNGAHGTADLRFKLDSLDRREPFADTPEQELASYFRPTIHGTAFEFKRVELRGVRPFYLSTTEVSLEQFMTVAAKAGAWPALRTGVPLGQPADRREPDAGPRVWEWATESAAAAAPIRSPEFWLFPEAANDYPEPFRTTRFNRRALSDAVGGNPSLDHPMQQVSAEAALYFAKLCGCRLPTSREWHGAYRVFEKGVARDRWNLRDRTWNRQRLYVGDLPEDQEFVPWPDAGAFRPRGASIPTGAAATAGEQDDGTLFFRPTTADGGGTFRHLVGNVAELICDAPGQFDRVGGGNNNIGNAPPAPAAITEFVAQTKNSLFVVGGSALSSPQLKVDEPYPLTETGQGYADVGFRLAFTAPVKTLAERLQWVLEEQPYLWRNTRGGNGPGGNGTGDETAAKADAPATADTGALKAPTE